MFSDKCVQVSIFAEEIETNILPANSNLTQNLTQNIISGEEKGARSKATKMNTNFLDFILQRK